MRYRRLAATKHQHEYRRQLPEPHIELLQSPPFFFLGGFWLAGVWIAASLGLNLRMSIQPSPLFRPYACCHQRQPCAHLHP
jgi:hypothetical protein